MIHKPHPDWGSHIPVLIKALEHTSGPVLELGIGISSTPLLHMLCEDQDRLLISYENDPQFVEMFKKYRSRTHEINLIENWNDLKLDDLKWGVAFVDHKPDDRRAIEVEKLAWQADVIVIHDSETDKNDLYHYDKIYNLFRYRFDYTKTNVHTTVLSNRYDLNQLYNSKP